MNYTLHQLRIFLKVAQTLSITKAADDLYLTQPAVSIQLKNFQKQFSVPLIEIINKKIYLTDFGKEIAAAADLILNEAYAINYRMHQYQGKLTGRLKISVVSTGKYVAPYFLSAFMQQHDGVELLMDVTNKAKVLESLEKNEVDFALVSILPEHLQVNKVELMQNKLFVVGNSDTPFKQKQLDKKVLEQMLLIYREMGSGTRLMMEKFIHQHKLKVNKKMELTTNEAVKQAVIAGLGYSIMPLIGIKNELFNKQLKIIPVKGFPLKTTWYLIWLKQKKLSPVADAYLQYIRKNKQQIIQQQFDWFERY